MMFVDFSNDENSLTRYEWGCLVLSSYRTYLPLVSQAGSEGSSLGQQLLTRELACQVRECPPLPAKLAQE